MSERKGDPPRAAAQRHERTGVSREPACPDFTHMNLEEGFEWPEPQRTDTNAHGEHQD
jgi:hypothetical protein